MEIYTWYRKGGTCFESLSFNWYVGYLLRGGSSTYWKDTGMNISPLNTVICVFSLNSSLFTPQSISSRFRRWRIILRLWVPQCPEKYQVHSGFRYLQYLSCGSNAWWHYPDNVIKNFLSSSPNAVSLLGLLSSLSGERLRLIFSLWW